MTLEAHSISTRCGICGSPDLEIDQVFCGGLLSLVSCPRCEYRYTESYGSPAPRP